MRIQVTPKHRLLHKTIDSVSKFDQLRKTPMVSAPSKLSETRIFVSLLHFLQATQICTNLVPTIWFNPLVSATAWSLLPRKSTQFGHYMKPTTTQIHSIRSLPEAYYRANLLNPTSAWSLLPGKFTSFRLPRQPDFQKLVLTIWLISITRAGVYIPLFNVSQTSCNHLHTVQNRSLGWEIWGSEWLPNPMISALWRKIV